MLLLFVSILSTSWIYNNVTFLQLKCQTHFTCEGGSLWTGLNVTWRWWLCNSKDNNSHDPALLRSFVLSGWRYVLCFFFFFLFIDSQMWFTSRLVHIFISGSWMLTKVNVEASVNWLWVVSLANLYVSWQQRSKTGPFLYAVIIQGLSNRNGKITLWHFVKIRYWIIRKPWWQVKKVFTGQSTRNTAHQHPSDTPLLTFRLFFL